MKNSKTTSRHNDEIKQIHSLTSEMKMLKEREYKLTERLISEHQLVSDLKKNPHFLQENDRTSLCSLVDDVFNDFTTRLTDRFPNLTEVDLLYCVLIKLRFSVSQIAILSAISPTSVSQQKSRMKKRMLSIEPSLFDKHKSMDSWIIDF